MSHPPELRRLARGGLGGLAGAGVSALSGVMFLAIVARGFRPAEIGLFFALSSVFLLALAVIELGSDVGLVRFLATYLAEGRRHHAAAVIVTVLAPTFLLALLVWVAVTTMSSVLTRALGGDQIGSADAMTVLLMAFLPVAAMSDLLLASTRGLGTIKPTLLADSMRQGLQPLLATIAVVAAPGRSSALVLSWAAPYVVSCLLALRAVIVELHRHDIGREHFRLRRGILTATASEVWRFNSARSLAQVAQMTIRRVDVPLVSAFAGPASAAVYSAASRFVAVGQLGIKGVQQMVGPQMARLLGEDRRPEAALVLRTATTWSVVIAWPVYLTFATIPDLLLSVFGPAYTAGATAVVILSMAMLVGTATGPVDIVLLMSGRSVLSLMNNLAALATNLVLNLFLIPRIGLVGAATAWAAAIVISNALPTLQIEAAVGFRANDRRTAQAALLAFACLAVAPALAWLFGLSDLWRVSAVVLGLVAYLLLLLRYRTELRLVELVSSIRQRR
jgi:O-antigen/teichoic acid export membrane protein